MRPTTWTLTHSIPAVAAPIRVFYLKDDNGLPAMYRVERLESDDSLRVWVAFGDTEPTLGRRGELYARAHAARMLAMCLDTIADLESEDPLEVNEPEISRSVVAVIGPGAVLATAAFFGEDIAEILFNTYA